MWRLTDEQRERRERIREFALEEVRPRMLEIDDTCDYPFDVHDALRREQLIGLAIPRSTAARAPTASRSAPISKSWPRSPRPRR
jgi:alkylation response protein AidB-like acyl-CoA dehydrogenase